MFTFSESKVDKSNMLNKIKNFPEHLIHGSELAEKISLPKNLKFDNILFLGMGGSAIGGDMLSSIYASEISVPFSINRNYTVPAYVSEKTLVIVSSYSGNTEETLSALFECEKRNTQFICTTTGGKLGEWANENNVLAVKLPPGLPPRAAFGYSFSSVFTILSRLGIIKDSVELLREIAQELKKANFTQDNSSAQKLALKLKNTLPIIYTAADIWQAVGTRFRGQIEENAKMLSYSSVFPEMNHNEIVGIQILGRLEKLVKPVYIFDDNIHARILKRMEFTIDEMKQKGLEPIIINAQGKTALQKVLHMVHMTDFTSYYLALLNDVDPTPVEIIENLKKRLAKL